MESQTIRPLAVTTKGIIHNLRNASNDDDNDDNNDNDDDDDDASQVMEEYLQAMMDRPLKETFHSQLEDTDVSLTTISHDMSTIDTTSCDIPVVNDKISQLGFNDISLIVFQDESIESINVNDTYLVNKSHRHRNNNNNKAQARSKKCSIQKSDNHPDNKMFETSNDYSSSSEGTTDDQQQHSSDQTCPETPPTPLSFDSSGHGSTSSSVIFVQEITQQQHDSPLTHSTPENNSDIGGRGNISSQSPTSSPNPSQQKKYTSASIRSSNMSYNPITSHSPQRKSRSRRQRATMGMSIFSCLDTAGDSDCDVLSDDGAEPKFMNHHHQRGVFRQRTFLAGDNDDDDDDVVSTCDSEIALENAAQIIRSQLLQNEMLTVAAEAEQAADSGMDRFTRHPMAGVIQDDLLRTTTTSHNRSHVQQRKLSIQAMRRSLSEGSYLPPPQQQQPRRIDRNKSSSNFVANIFPESIIPLSSKYIHPVVANVPSKNTIELRDVNEVFPSFQSFHAHLRTHFCRRDISPNQLLFQEENDMNENYNATAMTMNVIDGNNYSAVHTSDTPLQQRYPFCKSDDSPLGAVFALPLCSSETTTTPLITNRKVVGCDNRNHHQQHLPFPIDPSIPMHNFLQNFSFVDQWSNAISTHCRPNNINNLLIEASVIQRSEHDPPDDDAYIVNALSQQIQSSNSLPRLPRKIDMLPGLEPDCINHIFRQVLSPPTIRLRPKISNRHFSHDTDDNDVVSFVESSSPFKSAYCADDPKALFDETEYDSDDDYDGVLSKGDQEVIRMLTTGEPNLSLNSILDDPALRWTPMIGSRNMPPMCTVDTTADDTVAAVPPPIPDFVTPVRLRKIRGNATSNDSADTVVDTIAANLFLPLQTSPTPQDFLNIKKVTLRTESFGSRNDECKASFENEQSNSTLSDIYAIEEMAELEISTIEDEIIYLENPAEMRSLDPSISILDLNLSSSYVQKEVFLAATYSEINLQANHKPEICSGNIIGSSDCQVVSKSDPVVSAWLKDSQTLLKTPKSCRSLDGYATKEPSHHDCGCLSLSAASSTCSDDEIIRSNIKPDDDIFSAGAMSMRKVLSSDALNNHKSWDAILERFHNATTPNFLETSTDSTPNRKNSIRDAMSIISSTLSPRKSNDSTVQQKQHQEQQRRSLQNQEKENDEFMSNFLYCSKSSNEYNDDVTTTLISADATPTTQTDRVTSSFMCLDGNMMNCGETDTGYCCNYFFDGALTMGNILLPPSFSTRNRPANNPNGVLHAHHKVRSSINLGVIPGSRRESYHSDSTNHHNSSSWLDIAYDLDGAFDAWVMGESNCTQSPNVDEVDACLIHVSFQPPTLKKLRNIREDCSSDDEDDEHNDIRTQTTVLQPTGKDSSLLFDDERLTYSLEELKM